MITSADNRRWDNDIELSDLSTAGLPAPSVIRCAKIAIIEARDAERIGTLPHGERTAVAATLARMLTAAISPP
jgi:mRNA interferase MazF